MGAGMEDKCTAGWDKEAICDARIDGLTINAIRRRFAVGRDSVRNILKEAGLGDEGEDDTLSPARTKRMCARHLEDLQREHGAVR